MRKSIGTEKTVLDRGQSGERGNALSIFGLCDLAYHFINIYS